MTAHWSEPWGAWHRFALTTARSSPSKSIRLAHRSWHSPAVKMPAWQRATQEMRAATEAVPSIHSDEGLAATHFCGPESQLEAALQSARRPGEKGQQAPQHPQLPQAVVDGSACSLLTKPDPPTL